MGRFISRYIPTSLQKYTLKATFHCTGYWWEFLYAVRKLFYFGFTYYCPVCNARLRCFRPLICHDGYTRLDAKRCPVCGSLERHRWVWLFLEERTDLFAGQPKKMLHIAPEKSLMRHFQKVPCLDYLTGDIDPRRAMERIDITRIQYPDNCFDIIYCSHVLEHIPNDTQAIGEFYRVLKVGGWALIVVPIRGETTVENADVTEPEERRRVFGHAEHVRICGNDYKNRLLSAGFDVEVVRRSDVYSAVQARRLGLMEEPLFFCQKKEK